MSTNSQIAAYKLALQYAIAQLNRNPLFLERSHEDRGRWVVEIMLWHRMVYGISEDIFWF